VCDALDAPKKGFTGNGCSCKKILGALLQFKSLQSRGLQQVGKKQWLLRTTLQGTKKDKQQS
jgi:hypothetical protein